MIPLSSDPGRPTSASVLVAGDDPLRRDVLAEFLAMAGYRVRCARDAQDADALVAREVPAVVVADATMARTSGLALVQRLRAGGHGVPVVLVASSDVAVDLPGVVLVVAPFDLDRIAAAVGQRAAGR